MADRFSLDDIMSGSRKRKKDPEEGFDLSFSPPDEGEATAGREDIIDRDLSLDSPDGTEDRYMSPDSTDEESWDSDLTLEGEDGEEDVYIPRTAADLDDTAPLDASELAARRIKKMARQSGEDEDDELEAVPAKRASMKDIDLGDVEKKLIPRTGSLDVKKVIEAGTDEERSEALHEARREKVEGFKLDIGGGEDRDRSEDKVVGGQKEFERFEDAPRILSDILQVKNNLFLRLCVLLFSGIFSLLITVANDLGLPLIKVFDRSISPSAFLFTNTILGLLALAVSSHIMAAGVKNMFRRKPDCDSVTALGMFVTIAAGLVTLFEPESLRGGYYHVYVSAAIMGLIFNTLGKMMVIQRTEKNFRYIAGQFHRCAVKPVSEENTASFTKGATGGRVFMTSMQRTEFVEDFIKNSYAPDAADRFAQRASWGILLFGLAMGLMSFVMDKNATDATSKLHVALAAFGGSITMCSSVSLMLAVNVPVSRASKRFLQYSSVMLGYSAVEEYGDTNSVLVDAGELFPKESVDLINLKLLSNYSLEECILMAASLACQSGSVLYNSFYRILKGKMDMLYPVESYIFEDGQGISGWINNKRVLLGTREHMTNHSIDGLPPLSKERELGKDNVVVYLSISGVVATMFIVKVVPSLAVGKWLKELQREGIVTFVRTVDGFLSEDYLEELFGIGHGAVRLLPFRFHQEYEKETGFRERVSSSLLCSGHFPSFAMLMTGIKHIRATAQFGLAIQTGAMVLGAAICLICMLMGNFAQITPSLVVTYNLVFALISLIFLTGKSS